jgi:hypothetical protein
MKGPRMADDITVKLTFRRPESDQALGDAIHGMVMALPNGPHPVKLSIEGVPPDLASAFETAFAIGRAQIAARKSRKEASGR